MSASQGTVHVATDEQKYKVYAAKRDKAREQAEHDAYVNGLRDQLISSQKVNTLWESRSLSAPKAHRSQRIKNMPADHQNLGEGYVRHAVVYENVKREYPGYDTWKTTR